MASLTRIIAGAILLSPKGEFLLQKRDNIPHILFPGKIGLFGGHVETGEKPIETAIRELDEETGLNLPASEFELLVNYQTRYPDGAEVHGTFYIVRDITILPENVTEGSLLVVRAENIGETLINMTPATSFIIKTYLDLDVSRD